MKRALFYFAGMATIACAVSLFSCKKHNDAVPKPCRIVAEYDTVYGATITGESTMRTYSYQFNYDYQGRIIHQSQLPPTDTFSRIWTYGPDYTYVTPEYYPGSADTIFLDDSNLVAKVVSVESNNDITYTLYTYDAAGEVLTRTQKTNTSAGQQYITNYVWSDGDMASSKDNSGNFTTYSYYTDKLATVGDPYRFRETTTYGVPIVRNKHLIKSTLSAGGVINFNYTFDNSGRIATVSKAIGAFFEKTAYVYDCSQ